MMRWLLTAHKFTEDIQVVHLLLKWKKYESEARKS